MKEVTDQEGNVIEKEHYTIDENGNLTLKSSYLDTLKKGEYRIVTDVATACVGWTNI